MVADNNKTAHLSRIITYLMREGLLTGEMLEAAREVGCTEDPKIVNWLIDRNPQLEVRLLQAIGRLMGIELFDPEQYHLTEDLGRLFNVDFASDWRMVPVFVTKDVVRVAVCGLPDTTAFVKLEADLQEEVVPLLATRSDYETAMRLIYHRDAAFGQVLDDLHEQEESTGEVELVDKFEEENITVNAADEAPVIRLVNTILTEGVRQGASDVHISPEKTDILVRYRREGLLRKPTKVPKNLGPALASRIKIMGNMDISVTRMPQDGRFTVIVHGREINVRVSTLPTMYGENIVMRLLDVSSQRIYDLPSLGMNASDFAIIEEAAAKPHGMILSTGPTGSGKSTSLYSILQMINRPQINIITLEDPVEYRMAGIRQVELNVRAGMTFASGLRAILRQDPDVVMVGEIRDRETAAIAVQAALTGHMVLSTLHTNDAVSAISRLNDLGIENFLVASVLQCAFAQRLVRTICPHCRERYKPSPILLRKFGLPEDGEYWHGTGCPHCGGTGYVGRMAVFEIFPMRPAYKEAVTEGVSIQRLYRTALEDGLHTMAQDIAEKVLAGKTTLEEAARVTMV